MRRLPLAQVPPTLETPTTRSHGKGCLGWLPCRELNAALGAVQQRYDTSMIRYAVQTEGSGFCADISKDYRVFI